MLKKSTKQVKTSLATSAFEFVQWPVDEFAISNKIADKVLAIQTTRETPEKTPFHQVSPYESFNLGLHVGDCAKRVRNNRQCLQNHLPLNSKIQWLEQVHGNDVVVITNVSEQALTADAAITREKNTCLAVMTADCLPILLVSKKADEIAVIHGGWRPLSTNIISNTLAKMKTPADEVYAWLGPCISSRAFEVGSEVKLQFLQQGDSFNYAFTETIKDKCFADLQKIAALQLERLGITKISNLAECTYENEQKYYSYRKSSVTGRMATLICLC